MQVMLDGIVADETFQFADSDRFGFLAHDAGTFALRFLRAHTATHCWQSRVATDDTGSTHEVTFGNAGDEIGNVDIHGAMRHTLRVLAMQATLGFHDGHVSGIAQANLVKVMGTDFGFLLRHRDTLLLVEGFFGDASDVALVAFSLLLGFELLARFHIVIHGLTLHGTVEVDILSEELRAIDAGELGLAANAHAAGTAHARTVDHNRVE